MKNHTEGGEGPGTLDTRDQLRALIAAQMMAALLTEEHPGLRARLPAQAVGLADRLLDELERRPRDASGG